MRVLDYKKVAFLGFWVTTCINGPWPWQLVYVRRKARRNACFPHKHQNATSCDLKGSSQNHDPNRNHTLGWAQWWHELVYVRRKARRNACFPHKHQNATSCDFKGSSQNHDFNRNTSLVFGFRGCMKFCMFAGKLRRMVVFRTSTNTQPVAI